jgi:hypothetical protein
LRSTVETIEMNPLRAAPDGVEALDVPVDRT